MMIQEQVLVVVVRELLVPPRKVLSLKELSTRKVFEELILNKQGSLRPPSSTQLLTFCRSFSWMSTDDHKQVQAIMIDAIYLLLVRKQADEDTVGAIHCAVDFLFARDPPSFLAPSWFIPLIKGLLQFATLNSLAPILQQIDALEARFPNLIRSLRPVSTAIFINRAGYRIRVLPLFPQKPSVIRSIRSIMKLEPFSDALFEFFHPNPTKSEKRKIHSAYRSLSREMLKAGIIQKVVLDESTFHLPRISKHLRNNLHDLRFMVNCMKHAMLNGLPQYIHFPIELFYMDPMALLGRFGHYMIKDHDSEDEYDAIENVKLFLEHILVPLILLDDPLASYDAYAHHGFSSVSKISLRKILN